MSRNRPTKRLDATPFANSLTDELLRIRLDQKLTQETLALRSGLDRRTLQRAETRGARPTLLTVAAIADALGFEFVLFPKGLPCATEAATTELAKE